MPSADLVPPIAAPAYRRRRYVAYTLAALFTLALAAVGSVVWLLAGSRARLTGQAHLPGLTAPVTVSRDALGVATLDASNAADAMRALGYVHACMFIPDQNGRV